MIPSPMQTKGLSLYQGQVPNSLNFLNATESILDSLPFVKGLTFIKKRGNALLVSDPTRLKKLGFLPYYTIKDWRPKNAKCGDLIDVALTESGIEFVKEQWIEI